MGESVAFPAATFARALAARGIKCMPVYIAWLGVDPAEDAGIAAAFLDPDDAKQSLQQAMSWLSPDMPAALAWVERGGRWEATCCGLHVHIVMRKLHVAAPK
jgi:hypothetical protein